MNSNSITDIKRYPLKKNDLLQGWDAADSLILEHMSTLELQGKRILIINDQFGALSCGLINYSITTYTDSYVSYRGILFNSHEKVTPIHNLAELSGVYDYVLMQVPKNMSFLEDILIHLTHHVLPHSKLICGSMVKHLAPTSFDLINKYIGTTTTSLAVKKARLIFASFEKEKISNIYPQKIKMDGFEKTFINHSNLFSREKLDIGTRFFLEHIPKGDFTSILDLGCANGIIGVRARELNPNSQIHYSDESYQAILSATENYKNHFNDGPILHWTNCFEDGQKNSLDLVLCNPPFHQGTTVGDFIATQMFKDSYQSLRKGGLIRVIENSHLGYQAKLKHIFGNSKIVATNKKFMIVDAQK